MTERQKPILISIVGPTAVGKTTLAISVAKKYSTEIISSDSRQFYKELEIGTAKPTKKDLKTVNHHLIDNLSIHDYYSVGRFEQQAIEILKNSYREKNVMVMVGGSGLYCQAIWQGIDEMPAIDVSIREDLNRVYEKKGIAPLQRELKSLDPEYYDLVDQQNHARLIRALEVIRSTGQTFSSFRKGSESVERPFEMVNIGLEMDILKLYDRINSRMDRMIERGLFDEANQFYDFRNLNALRTVGYQEIYGFIDGSYDKEEAIRLLKRNSRRYAKRQMTWFKKDATINWFSVGDPIHGFEKVLEFLEKKLG
ncbi:MAG: tRNA (adenosine(37)-N6)-dimethylallyltransferase MiaA [Cyclobacteriaceae bacterium]